jgi:putative membrane protein
MGKLLVRLVATAAALFAAVAIVPGVGLGGAEDGRVTDPRIIFNLLIVAAIFGFVNAILKPLLKFTTCLINVVTLGLFTLVINAFLFWLTSAIARRLGLGFEVDGIVAAVLGSIVVSVVSIVLSVFIRDDDD